MCTVPGWPSSSSRAAATAAATRSKEATAAKVMPGMREETTEESLCAPVAMTTSPTATVDDIPPAVPTRMIRCTSYSRNSSVA